MKKDALELIQATALKSAVPSVVRIDGDPDNVVVSYNGQKEIYPLPPKHRSHSVKDIDSLLDLADKNGGHGEDAESTAILWHSEDAIVLVFDDGVRRDIATLKLEFSKPFKALQSMDNGRVFNQPALIRLLKVDLKGCVPDTLLTAVRDIRFSRTEEGTAKLDHGQATLGKSVEAKVTSADKLPESFLVSTEIYSNVLQDISATVEVDIDISLEDHTFTLSVVGDGLAKAMLETQSHLAESLGNDTRRVLFGKP